MIDASVHWLLNLEGVLPVASVVIASASIVGGALWTVFVFSTNRGRETAFKRTEFLIQLSQQFHNDPVIMECVAIAEGRHPDHSMEEFLAVAQKRPLSDAELLLYQKFEHFISFLWMLAYAYLELKSLTLKDLNAFGFWFECVCRHPGLHDYCVKEGYEEVVKAWNRLPD